jgi:hypothetical protein
MGKRKKLAIKGHTTCGKEVIKILEMLGGYNKYNMEGNQEFGFSYIINNNDDNNIECRCVSSDEFKIFTLEEFLEKFPYQKRQRVNVFDGLDGAEGGEIFKMRWDGKKIIYTIEINNDYYEYTAKELNRWNKYDEKQDSQCDNCSFFGTWKCIDYGDKCNNGKIIEKSEMNMNDNNVDLTCKGEIYHGNRISYVIPDGYEFSKIENNEIIIQKKKPIYPKTYEECCDVIGINRHEVEIDIPRPYQQNMFNLFKLLICRDAYWKIAGDEMGLGKPWNPCDTKDKYSIRRVEDKILLHYNVSSVLEFPTTKMRDLFYTSFKDLIEKCKDLL